MESFDFIKSLEEKNIILSPEQIKQFNIYYKMLVEWNEKMNLTAITDESEVYLKHFYDSISAAFYYNFNRPISICDIGAGAGFPSIPLKICFPEVKVTIVDSLNKRITFLEELVKELKIDDVYAYHDRAELFGKNKTNRESYDVVMARAVARMSVLSELCLPLVKVGGDFIVMKGNKFNEELEDGKQAIKVLGGKVKENYHFSLPIEDSDRYISVIEKISKTPSKYPRKPGTPNKTPIGS